MDQYSGEGRMAALQMLEISLTELESRMAELPPVSRVTFDFGSGQISSFGVHTDLVPQLMRMISDRIASELGEEQQN